MAQRAVSTHFALDPQNADAAATSNRRRPAPSERTRTSPASLPFTQSSLPRLRYPTQQTAGAPFGAPMKGPTSPTDRAKNHRFARPPADAATKCRRGPPHPITPPKKRHPRLQKTSGAASGESGIRTHGDISTTLDFESSALDQLSHLSLCVRSNAAVLCTQRSALSSTFLVKHATREL